MGGLPTGNSTTLNFSTAVDTRSLSITSTGRLSDTGSPQNPAHRYYENPTGKVSALLQHSYEWVDSTSQQSKSLPDGFHNAPYAEYSKILYDSDNSNLTFRAPFSSRANWTESGIEALFYSPAIAPLASGRQPVSISYDAYTINSTGSGNSSGSMHDKKPCIPNAYPQIDIYDSYANRFPPPLLDTGLQLDQRIRYRNVEHSGGDLHQWHTASIHKYRRSYGQYFPFREAW